jgi:hypothetical protein
MNSACIGAHPVATARPSRARRKSSLPECCSLPPRTRCESRYAALSCSAKDQPAHPYAGVRRSATHPWKLAVGVLPPDGPREQLQPSEITQCDPRDSCKNVCSARIALQPRARRTHWKWGRHGRSCWVKTPTSCKPSGNPKQMARCPRATTTSAKEEAGRTLRREPQLARSGIAPWSRAVARWFGSGVARASPDDCDTAAIAPGASSCPRVGCRIRASTRVGWR